MMGAFFAVLNMSIASAVLLVLALVWRWALRRYGTAGFRYLVWLPFLFRLLIPYSLPSGLSVYNLFHGGLESPGGTLLSMVYLDPSTLYAQSLAAGQALVEKQLQTVGCLVWAAGVGLMVGAFLLRYLRLRQALATALRLPQGETGPLLVRVGLRRKVPVLCTGAVQGPIVFGILHPRVLLPISLWQQDAGREYILLHEFTHVRWGDYLLLMVGNLAVALHWFNPFVWIARRMMAQDVERACDARVLQRLDERGQLAYAETLVNWAGRRSGWGSYAAFGDRDVVRRVRGVLGWKRLPRWTQILLTCVTLAVFLCVATNPVLRQDAYLPVSSPFVSEAAKEQFRQAAFRLTDALESADPMALAEQASMDPAYFAPLYADLADLRLTVDGMRLFCNSADAAELYLQVTVEDGAGLYQAGQGTLVAHLVRTEYRAEPIVDCLMPQTKYETMRLADTGSEAARLAVRLCADLEPGDFAANNISPVAVARVCMASAIADKGESPPFSQKRMEQLAREYFALDSFSCQDPSVYDQATGTYFYQETPEARMCVTQWDEMGEGRVRVTVESYEDPLCLYPQRRLECEMQKTG